MAGKMPNLMFHLMAGIGIPIRNLFMPPEKMMDEVGIEPGDSILDFGCGPGHFALLAAERTGPEGRVHALDIHPLAARAVEKKARARGFRNIRTIVSDCDTALPDSSLDRVLLLDVFHLLDHPQDVLRELHRVLKPGATLCFSDHHMKEEAILSSLGESGLFQLEKKGQRTFRFVRT